MRIQQSRQQPWLGRQGTLGFPATTSVPTRIAIAGTFRAAQLGSNPAV